MAHGPFSRCSRFSGNQIKEEGEEELVVQMHAQGRAFYFGTLGYSAGDVLELHTEVKEHHHYCPRFIWVVLILGRWSYFFVLPLERLRCYLCLNCKKNFVGFTAYATYQIYLCIESYEEPEWGPAIDHYVRFSFYINNAHDGHTLNHYHSAKDATRFLF